MGIDRDTVTVKHAPHPMDATCDDPSPITIPMYTVQVPIGWQPRYTIHCKPEKTNEVLGWFARGIVVRQSHNLSGSMPTAFQPLTNGNIPSASHWQFPEDTDVVLAEECAKVFKVVAVEEQEITSEVLGFPPDATCNRCKGTGRDTVARVAEVRGVAVESLDVASLHVDDYQEIDGSFRCTCHYGALTRMGRSKRAKLFKEMEGKGWEIEHVKHLGGFWIRRRETLVKDWD